MSNQMDKIIVWYYKIYPTLLTFEWKTYRDIEIDILEEAFEKKESHVLLDKYRIDLKEFLQIDLDDETKRCPVKRDRVSHDQYHPREYRFASLLPTSPSSSFGAHNSWCPFLTAWFETSSGKRAVTDSRRCLEYCAQGIIKEGSLYGDNNNSIAMYMAGRIRQCIGRATIEATKLCIHFYTKDTFLYYVLNKALREDDQSKLETLGPFCFLLRNYSRFCQDYCGTVFRGVQLTNEEILTYQNAISHWKTWPAFTSTSQDRETAKMFGNTLFIIDISKIPFNSPRSFDIAEISHFPHEREILIPAGISFQIIDVECLAQGENIIKVKI